MDTPCIEVTGPRQTDGYGQTSVFVPREYKILAHRLVWEQTHGPIPQGLVVCHICDNRGCINVDHMFIGTQKDNLQDMTDKGRRYYASRGRA